MQQQCARMTPDEEGAKMEPKTRQGSPKGRPTKQYTKSVYVSFTKSIIGTKLGASFDLKILNIPSESRQCPE